MDESTLAAAEIWGVTLGLAFVAVIVGAVMFALLRAASRAPDAMITISLSVLTLVAIAGFIATRSETLGAIAASGVGALGGALTAIFKGTPPAPDTPPTQEDTT